jgi:hypothetical protein
MAHQRSSDTLPLARRADSLLVERVNDEVLIFDTASQKGHCLDATAALVWERCDGSSSVAEVAATIEARGHQDGRAIVEAALVELAAASLIVPGGSGRARRAAISRRRALLTVGAVAGAVFVQSLVAPPAWAGCSPAGTVPLGGCGNCCNHRGCNGMGKCI